MGCNFQCSFDGGSDKIPKPCTMIQVNHIQSNYNIGYHISICCRYNKSFCVILWRQYSNIALQLSDIYCSWYNGQISESLIERRLSLKSFMCTSDHTIVVLFKMLLFIIPSFAVPSKSVFLSGN